MSDQREISITELTKISDELMDSFFPTQDLYSLLVLSLITIANYSRKNKHLSSATRIDLSITYLPDLIQFLEKHNTISPNVSKLLTKQIQDKRDDLPLILQSYIYAAGGLRIKMEAKRTHKHCIIT